MKKNNFIISIDQGTTSSRTILFNTSGNIVFKSQLEFKQFYPKDGWVEHNPEDIWKTTRKTLLNVINKSNKLKGNILTLGITNQRETTILWDKITGKPVYNAIVWQDNRTADFCNKIRSKKIENIINKKTGLFIDPYFSATKIHWILNNVTKVKKLVKKKHLLFGTVDTFILWRLTNGLVHATDSTNASRTMLYNLSTNCWDDEILKRFKIPKDILPVIKDSSDNYGETHKSITGKSISISAVIGDQQAALIGQRCFKKGSVKSTYGTGAFFMVNTGNNKIYSNNRLITTLAYRLRGKSVFALEGSIFIAGASVQWLRDKVKLIKRANETEKIIKSLTNNSGVYLVPAFTGLGAPHWDSKARGLLSGLTRNTGYREIIRATIESTAYQTHDLFIAMRKDGLKFKEIKIDGGMSMNDWFSQFLSDILNVRIKRPKIVESTALGAAFMAGLNIGTFKSLNDISKKKVITRKFNPKIDYRKRKILLNGWSNALKKAMIR